MRRAAFIAAAGLAAVGLSRGPGLALAAASLAAGLLAMALIVAGIGAAASRRRRPAAAAECRERVSRPAGAAPRAYPSARPPAEPCAEGCGRPGTVDHLGMLVCPECAERLAELVRQVREHEDAGTWRVPAPPLLTDAERSAFEDIARAEEQ